MANYLLELMNQDSELAGKVIHAASPEEALDAVKSVDSRYTLERLDRELDELTALDTNASAELDFSQLETVAGGVVGQKNTLLTDEQMKRIQERLDRRHHRNSEH